jgi:hypothetical protein
MPEEDFSTSLLLSMTLVDIYIYLMRHKSELFESSKNFKMKYKINLARQLNFCDQIMEVNI